MQQHLKKVFEKKAGAVKIYKIQKLCPGKTKGQNYSRNNNKVVKVLIQDFAEP